jgi:RecA-family ATPase
MTRAKYCAVTELNPYVTRIEARAERDLAALSRAKGFVPPLSRVAPLSTAVRSGIQQAAPAKAQADGVELIDATSIKPEAHRWLWPGWLARGKLHVLAGAPGTGKTTIALHIAACVSAGRPLPSGSRPDRGNVIIWSGEDDPADTLAPRLLAASADMTHIKFVGEVSENGERYPFDPARDVDKLKAAAAKVENVVLLIIDPLVSAVSGDSHKNAEVRRGLAPLVELAAKLGAALIGITHYSKGTTGRDPLERVTGSIAFGALARIVFGTVRQEAEEGESRKMMFARAKSNIGPDGGGFTYAVEQVEIERGIHTSKIAWGVAVEGTARELLAEAEPDCEHGEARDAAKWLRDALEAGPVSVKVLRGQSNDAGFAWRTVQRAMRSAGVESKRGGFGMPATWEISTQPVQLRHSRQETEAQKHGATGATVAEALSSDDAEVAEL